MAKRSDIDKAISNIMNWANRPEWSDDRATVFDAHLSPVCERTGMSQEELGHAVDDHGYGGMLFGIMFEDFLSRRLPPDDRNVIEDYLTRRGWRESVPGRRYLQQLRDSVLSLYEIIAISPGRHCDLRDLLRKGETIRVHEHQGTQNIVKWDRIAARVLDTNGKHLFAGGILHFPYEAAQSLLNVLDESRKTFNKEFARVVGKKAEDKERASENADRIFLGETAPAFTSVWLMHTLESLHEPLPELVNRNGEALVFTETRFSFPAERFDEITERLDSAPDWERNSPDEHTWLWFPEQDPDKNTLKRGMAIKTFREGQRPISGTLKLTRRAFSLTTNSKERAERGKNALETLLHGLVGPALSKLQTPEQLMAERDSYRHADTDQQSKEAIDPEVAAEAIRQMLDQHYRQCLDEPIPALGHKTPRQCARSNKSREKVIDWLKQLENNEQRRAARDGQTPYDSSWIWDELGLGQYQK